MLGQLRLSEQREHLGSWVTDFMHISLPRWNLAYHHSPLTFSESMPCKISLGIGLPYGQHTSPL